MPTLGPIKRSDPIQYLRQLGFDGPYSGGKHQFMITGGATVTLLNPHQSDIGREFLARMLRQAGVSRDVWEKL